MKSRFYTGFERIIHSQSLPYFILISAFLVRLGYMLIMGSDSFELHPDTHRYLQQSSQVMSLDFDLKTALFISAPFYPCIMAVFRTVCGDFWIAALQLFQILLASLSVFYLYKLGNLLFEKSTAVIAVILYLFFPFTLWWVYTFTQDSVFQSLFIFFIYCLVSGTKEQSLKKLIISAFLFGVTFMTKSHILMFSPFILLYIFLNWPKLPFYNYVFYALICFMVSLPYGLYHLQKNGVFIIGSTGIGGHFLTGHNEDAYIYLVETPARNSPEYLRLSKMDLKILKEQKDNLLDMTQTQKQNLFLLEGLKWCWNNPDKFVRLELYDLLSFLTPGISYKHYSFLPWLLSFLISLPIYFFAYWKIIILLKKNFMEHSWIGFLFLTCLIFSTIFYVQNRFRTITIEPFYLLYAAAMIDLVIKRIIKNYNCVSSNNK